MPQTINGIGTHYYGKKNLEREVATCEFCHQVAELQSYETRLFFVVIFVPLVPLERKQIVDYCPLCTQHRALPVDQWHKIKDQAIESTATQLSEKMDDPNAAIQHLGSLTAFRQMDELRDLATAIEASHPGDVEAQFRLGVWHEQYGQSPDADRCFDQAYELDPEHRGALRAHLVGLMQRGQLEQATTLLKKFELPAQDYDPGLFFQMATALQKDNRHAEAIGVFQKIAADVPALAKAEEMRKAVKISEKATGTRPDNIPKQSVFASKPMWLAMVVCALIVAFVVASILIAGNRKLYIVNGLNQPLVVKIDGKGPHQVRPFKYETIDLGEGRHELEIVSPASMAATKPFNFSSNFLTRLFANPVFVLDPCESATVFWQSTVYSARPAGDGETRMSVGQTISSYPNVDYPFLPFPPSLKSNRGSTVTKTRVDFVPFDPVIFLSNDAEVPVERQMDLIENWVLQDLADKNRLDSCITVSMIIGQGKRCEEFLESRLKDRPLMVELHRAYQSTAQRRGKSKSELTVLYDRYLSTEPPTADLYYLRGRLEDDRKASKPFFSKAIELDADHRYTNAAMAFEEFCLGNFQQAAERYDRALKLDENDYQTRKYFIESLFGAKDYDRLDKILNFQPDELSELQDAVNLLTVTNQNDRIGQVFNAYQSKTRSRNVDAIDGQLYLWYLEKEFAEIRRRAGGLATQFEILYHTFLADVELGNVDRAIQTLPQLAAEIPAVLQALVVITAILEKQSSAEQEQLKQLLAILDVSGSTNQLIAKLVRESQAGEVDVAELKSIVIEPREKKIYAALIKLLAKSPDPELSAMIETMNYDMTFPYHIINRALGK